MPVTPYICNNNIRRKSCDHTLNDRGKKLVSFANSSHWQIINGYFGKVQYTRSDLLNKSSSVIDYIFVKNMDHYAHSFDLITRNHTYELGISDHAMLEFKCDLNDVPS